MATARDRKQIVRDRNFLAQRPPEKIADEEKNMINRAMATL